MLTFDMLNIVFGLVGVLGTSAAFFFERRARRLAIDKNRFSWFDVDSICRQLGHLALRRWKPDVIVTLNGGPGIVAHLMIVQYKYQHVTIYTCLSVKKQTKAAAKIKELPQYKRIETQKYSFYLPNALLEESSNKKILIITDDAPSGTSLYSIRNTIVASGKPEENVRTCTMIHTNVAVRSGQEPDYSIFLVNSTDYHVPWKPYDP